jgi:UDP-N-acetylmuramoylalanine--D-glutamate ligase
VLNGDVPEVLALHRLLPAGHPAREALPGFVHRFSLHDPTADAWYDRTAGQLMLFGAPLLPRGALPLVGDHNVANALAAALAVSVADFNHRAPEARRAIADALAMFRALPHRLEVVAMRDGVTWINDSKSTNVGSTLVAVQGMDRPAVVLLGGRHKGEPYTPLLPALRTAARAVLAYGEAAPLIERDLAGHVPFERLGSSFDEVVARARALAQPGDAILLSPACSSYDMFANYQDRGDTFRRLATA